MATLNYRPPDEDREALVRAALRKWETGILILMVVMLVLGVVCGFLGFFLGNLAF
jgi:hypothetical protein